jgi:hypothetical protein
MARKRFADLVRSRAFARTVAKSLVPGSELGVLALIGLARTISLLPAGVNRAIAKLSGKGVRLYDTMRAPDYPVPAPSGNG